MKSGNKSLRKADTLIAIIGVIVAGAVWLSLNRDQGYLVPPPPGSDPGKAGSTPAQNTEGAKQLDDPSLPANVNQAAHLYEQARDREKVEDRKAAIALYQQACKLDPQRKFYWSSLANVASLDGRLDIAFPAYKEAYNLDVYEVFNLTRLGYVSSQMRKDNDARRYYIMALCLQPDNGDAWNDLYALSHDYPWSQFSQQLHQAVVSPNDSDNDKLIYALNQFCLDQNPDDYYFLVNRALLNLKFVRLETVNADVEKALKINPRGPGALLCKAQYLTLSGQYDKAMQAYRQCIAVSPQPVAYAELGTLEMQSGKIDDALREYKKATELGNDKPSWVNTLNKLVEMKKKRDQEAQDQAKKSGSKV